MAGRAHTHTGAIKSGSLGGLSSSPKLLHRALFTSFHSHPHPHRETIYSPVKKEGRRGAHCCERLGVGLTLLLASEEGAKYANTEKEIGACTWVASAKMKMFVGENRLESLHLQVTCLFWLGGTGPGCASSEAHSCPQCAVYKYGGRVLAGQSERKNLSLESIFSFWLWWHLSDNVGSQAGRFISFGK